MFITLFNHSVYGNFSGLLPMMRKLFLIVVVWF